MKNTKAGCLKYGAVVALCFLSCFASATIVYDEGVDGDSGLYSGASTLFLLNETQLIKGSWSWPAYANVDTDSYLFALSDKQFVTNIELSLSNKENYGDNQWALYKKIGSSYKAQLIASVTISLLDPYTDYTLLSTQDQAITSGEYFLINESAGKPTHRLSAAYDYQINLSMVAIPLPGALGLFLMSLIALTHKKLINY